MKKKLILIDGNSIMFRSYFATAFSGKVMTNEKGFPINALMTMHKMIDKILNNFNPDYALVAFDSRKKTFRHKELVDYKAGRAKTPEELILQIQPIQEMMRRKGLAVYSQEGYEADDIIGTLAKQGAKQGYEVHCFSSDKDLFQLVEDDISIQWIKNKGEIDVINPISFAEKYEGLTPIQLIDLKGIEGDSSDNLKGITGIGAKTGIKLLKEYGSLNNILNNIDSLSPGQKTKFEEHKEMGLLCKRMATIITDMTLDFSIEHLKYNGDKVEKLREFYTQYGLKQFLNKLPAPVIKAEVEQGTLF